MPVGITAIFHLAYDWMMAGEAIARIAPFVDRVMIVTDSGHKTWTLCDYKAPDYNYMLNKLVNRGVETGHFSLIQVPFHTEEYHGEAMKRIQDHQHILGLSNPLRKETLQRNWATLQVEEGHWILQLDGDEWMEKPKDFCGWLRDLPQTNIVSAQWLNVWKVLDNDLLIIDPATNPNKARIATARRGDLRVSRSPIRGTNVNSPYSILHWTLGGRGALGIEEKLKGWGFLTPERADTFVEYWKTINEKNYKLARWLTPSMPDGYAKQKLLLVPKETYNARFSITDLDEFVQ